MVDDNRTFLRSAVRVLASVEDVVVVGQATCGRSAIEAVARLKPDFVLMDLSMPEMDGITATRRIVTEMEPPSIVIMTVLDLPEYREAALAAGACEFLSKAVLSERLTALVKALRSSCGRGPDSARSAVSPCCPHRLR